MRKRVMPLAMAVIISLSAVCSLGCDVSAGLVNKGEQNIYSDTDAGWKTVGGKKYYYDKDGKAVVGLKVISGKRYYFDSEKKGQMTIGFKTINGSLYYFKKNGVGQVGWLNLDGKKYYFKKNGKAATGRTIIDNSEYNFDKNGVMIQETYDRNTYSNTSRKLSDPKADRNALLEYNYVCDTFGTAIISAQQESTWMGSPDYEVDYIKKVSGKYPAMRGLDFMNDDFDGCVDRAKKWHKQGGLVTICWHCGVTGKGYEESKSDDPDFSKLLKEGTPEHKAMLKSWDKAAAALSELQEAGVPVFWRPFHEFDGQWFWWGKGGKDNFIALWRMQYDYFTNEKGLHNLIWVLGYADYVKDGWYPGDDYCDIIGSDTYKSATNKLGWSQLTKMGSSKPLTFHECGAVPSVSALEKDGCLWAWFMVWHTEYIINTPKSDIKNTYNSDKVITLDELPKFK